MLRLDPSCTIFTSTHLLLVRLCLHSRAYASALPVLDRHVCHFPAVSGRLPMNSQSPPWSEQVSSLSFITEASGLSSGVSYRDYLKYFLYGGLVYMALKEWRKASHFLGIVISTPTSGCASMIMVEAYKKWILVGLIQDGKVSKTGEDSCYCFARLTYLSSSCVLLRPSRHPRLPSSINHSPNLTSILLMYSNVGIWTW